MTEIATDESKKMTMKWINLLFCIPPKSEKDLLQEKVKIAERERIKKLKSDKKKRK